MRSSQVTRSSGSVTRRRFALGSGLLLAGCAAPASGEVFEGLYSWGFEESVFAPCDEDERWWVVNDGDLVERYKTVAERDYEQVFTRVRGTVSAPGRYGHGGQYPRQIEITRVLDVREKREGDCR